MRSISHRSFVNSNNAGHYNRSDRAIDASEGRNRNITGIIGRPEGDDSIPMPTRRATPLRSGLDGRTAPTTGVSVRVYADTGDGRTLVGMALSTGSLMTLVERGYLDGDSVYVKGRIGGKPVEATIGEHQFDGFRMAVAV